MTCAVIFAFSVLSLAVTLAVFPVRAFPLAESALISVVCVPVIVLPSTVNVTPLGTLHLIFSPATTLLTIRSHAGLLAFCKTISSVLNVGSVRAGGLGGSSAQTGLTHRDAVRASARASAPRRRKKACFISRRSFDRKWFRKRGSGRGSARSRGNCLIRWQIYLKCDHELSIYRIHDPHLNSRAFHRRT